MSHLASRRRLIARESRLSARDAIRVAVMHRHDIDDILTFDTGFDVVTGLRRQPA